MIQNTIRDLEAWLSNNAAVNCGVGNIDLQPDQYPFVRLIPNVSHTLYAHNIKLNTVDLPISLNIVVDKCQELDAFNTYETIIRKILQFQSAKGHYLSESVESSYTETTFELTPVLVLKITLIDL